MVLEIPDLIGKLRQDSDSVLDESDDDEKASEGGDVGFDGLGVEFYIYIKLEKGFIQRCRKRKTDKARVSQTCGLQSEKELPRKSK